MSDDVNSELTRPRIVYQQTTRTSRRELPLFVRLSCIVAIGALVGLGASYLLRYLGY